MVPPREQPPSGPAGTPDPAEAALLARLRQGDAAAFEALVDRHGGPLLRLARSFVKVPAVAEEVVQDTWLAALDGLAGFEGRSSLRTWLFRILANKARTRAVREGRSVPWSSLGPGDDGPSVDPDCFQPDGHWKQAITGWTEEDPERLALGAETRAAIEAAIGALPENQRAVITLRDVEGVEAEEACAILGLSEANQRVLLHRARTRVRMALHDHLGGARG
jgi:RNA polymerase sigma-70 factor (ECF subfamily)